MRSVTLLLHPKTELQEFRQGCCAHLERHWPGTVLAHFPNERPSRFRQEHVLLAAMACRGILLQCDTYALSAIRRHTHFFTEIGLGCMYRFDPGGKLCLSGNSLFSRLVPCLTSVSRRLMPRLGLLESSRRIRRPCVLPVTPGRRWNPTTAETICQGQIRVLQDKSDRFAHNGENSSGKQAVCSLAGHRIWKAHSCPFFTCLI